MVNLMINRTPSIGAPQSRSTRRRFTTRALALALCSSALSHTPALAQSFQGTPTAIIGNPTITPGTGTTTITLNETETVINWLVDDSAGSFIFQPTGTNASFYSNSDFIVLNRILPQNGNAVITMDGSINSNIISATGGQIWFYTPGGFLIGSNASFDVGSLVLTTSDIDMTGGLLGSEGEIRFRGSPATSSIVISSGAEITASSMDNSSYVAMLAPRIVQGGRIDVDGSTALVAAEQADLRFSAGLFDVSVLVGSGDANGIVHTGTTTGAGAESSADVQRIAMVAVPKNDAMTMLLSGSIGYEPAVIADQDGSAVLLSAGYDLEGDTNLPSAATGTGLVNVTIDDANITSVLGEIPWEGTRPNASGTITIGGTGSVNFLHEVNLWSETAINITANAGQEIIFNDTTRLTATNGMTGGDITLTAGPASTPLAAGLIQVLGDLSLDVSANDSSIGSGINATAGTILLTAEGGEISASSFSFSAVADGAENGNAQGGSITLEATAEGTIDSGSTTLFATAFGGYGYDRGGNGTGGSISISGDSANLSLGNLQLFTNGTGGGSDTQGGDGYSGDVSLSVNDMTMTLDGLYIMSEAQSGTAYGSSAVTGSAFGNAEAISITVSGTGELGVSGDLSLDARSRVTHVGAEGGQVRGGGVSITVSDEGYAHFDQGLVINADAIVFNENPDLVGAFTADALGGNITIQTTGSGTLETPYIDLTANATGAGATDTAGSALGGSIHVDAANGAIIALDGDISFQAIGFGGTGPVSASGQGGTVRATVSGGTLQTSGDILLDATGRFASAFPGTDPVGAVTNRGGTAILESLSPGGTLIFSSAEIIAEGAGFVRDGDSPILAVFSDGSNGVGGIGSLIMAGGSIEGSQVVISTMGYGGSGANNMGPEVFTGGAGEGGASLLSMTGGTLGIGNLVIQASGFGGADVNDAPGTASIGGAGRGGSATMAISNANVNVSSVIDIAADGLGGNGGFGGDGAGGAAGAGTGGTTGASFSGLTNLNSEGINAHARGVGGEGGMSFSSPSGVGGNATGGSASVALGDATFQLTDVTIDAGADGGSGSTGGNAIGGSTSFTITDVALLADPDLAEGMQREISELTLSAAGNGGAGPINDGTSTGGSGSVSVSAGSASIAPTLTGALSANLGTGLAPASGQGFSLTTGNTAFSIGDNLNITTSGAININAGAGAPLLVGNDFNAATSSNFTGTGEIDVTGSSTIIADSGIAFNVLHVGGDASLNAAEGAIAVTGDLAVGGSLYADGRSVAVTAAEQLFLGNIQASAGGISITSGDAVTFTEATTAPGAITVNSGGAVLVRAAMTGTSITLAGMSVTAMDDARLNATSGDIAITAINDANIGYIVDAAAALRVTAGGTAQFGADIMGRDIAINAANILLDPNANIGSLERTRTIALTFTGPGPVSLGGASVPNAGLSADDIGRLFAQDSIDLFAGNAAQEIFIDSFSLASGPNGTLGSSARFGITGYGRMIVSGLIDFTTDSNDATLELGAANIAILSDNGGITLHDGADVRQGQLLFTAGRLFVGSNAALSAIDGLSNVQEIADILHAPPEGASLRDSIIAGHIGATVSDALYIQNTGASDAFEDRQGFLANSFAITNGTAGPVSISINGRLGREAGTFLTGFDVASAITQNGVPLGLATGAYRPFSTVNGCVLGQTCGGGTSLVPPRETLSVETVIGKPPLLEMQQLPITFGDMPLFETVPLVDEPVTGVGNEDLWDAEKP